MTSNPAPKGAFMKNKKAAKAKRIAQRNARPFSISYPNGTIAHYSVAKKGSRVVTYTQGETT